VSSLGDVPRPRGSLLAYFAAAYAVAWAFFIPVARGIPARGPLGGTLVFLGAISPSFVSLALTFRNEGRAGVRALLDRLWPRPVPGWLYAFALGYMAAVKLAVALVVRVSTGAWPRFGELPWFLLPFAVAVSTPVQAGEELGWRGYALPRLAARMGLARASLLLGILWACWHLPLFFVRDADTYGQSFFVYTLEVIAISVVIAFLYARSQGGLFLPMLLHAAVNNTKDIVPSATPGAHDTFRVHASLVAWLTVALLWVSAGFLLPRMRRLSLPRG